MLEILQSPIFALAVTVLLTALPWAIRRIQSLLTTSFRRLDSPSSAWSRVERFSKIASSSEDKYIKEAIHGALFDALRTTTFRQVRRPWRRQLFTAGLYILLGCTLIATNSFTVVTSNGGVAALLSTTLGLAVAAMSLVWIQSSLREFRRNIVFRNRIELLIERKDLRFMRDPVRAVWMHGAESLTDRAFDTLWVHMWHAADAAQVRHARRLSQIIRESLNSIRGELNATAEPSDDGLSVQIDLLERRIDSWFKRQSSFRRPIGPRRSALQVAKSLSKRRSITSLRAVRGSS